MNVLDLAQARVQMRKAAMTHGGEWQGPCPACGGENRFHVWPLQNDGDGAYWCRQCGLHGDAIQFLRDFEGLGFREACARLGVQRAERDRATAPPSQARPPSRPEFVPAEPEAPPEAWQAKAWAFVRWASDHLRHNDEALAWLHARGLEADAACACWLGWNPGEEGRDLYRPRKAWGLAEALRDDGRPRALWLPRGLVIPCIGQTDPRLDPAGGRRSEGDDVAAAAPSILRIRIRRPDGEPRYYVLPGSAATTMVCHPERRAFVVVESELDAIAVASACPLAGAVALGSVAAKPDRAATRLLAGALQILNALDYDAAGARAMAWWKDTFPRCDRWPAPAGKDPGEAVRLGMDLDRWVRAGLPPALTLGADGPKETPRADAPGAGAAIAGAVPPGPAAEGETDPAPGNDIPPAVIELAGLLRKNPGVRIVNTPSRYTVLKDGRYVGGRINELVFRDPDVIAYVQHHPAAEIHGGNLIE